MADFPISISTNPNDIGFGISVVVNQPEVKLSVVVSVVKTLAARYWPESSKANFETSPSPKPDWIARSV